jgi:hypothetical protein
MLFLPNATSGIIKTTMKTKPLIETNPYLKDSKMRKKLIARSVRTSCGVEGIEAKGESLPHIDIPRRKNKKPRSA